MAADGSAGSPVGDDAKHPDGTPDILDACLRAIPLDALREILRKQIERMPPEERRAALDRAVSSVPAAPQEGGDGGEPPGEPEGAAPCETDASVPDRLLRDVDAFVERLRSGAFFRGRRWDANLGRERSIGDESWVEEMDALFARACDTLREGEHDAAGRALGALLETFLLPDRDSLFVGPTSPEAMVRTDLDAVKACYLRCVYEASSEEQRVKTLLREIERFLRVGSRDLGLTRIIAVDPAPLSGLEPFLPCWLERLSSLPPEPDRPHWDEVIRLLIRETLVLTGGTDALRELAKSQGALHPEAYHDWVRALEHQGRRAEAIAAAREGIAAIADRWHLAHLCDRLAALEELSGHADLAFDARRGAWRAYPTLERLLAICRDAQDRGVLDRTIDEEAKELCVEAGDRWARAAARLLVLAGDAEGIARLLADASGRGWSRSHHPGPVGLPFLLAFGCGAVPPPAGSFLAGLWEAMAGTHREHARGRRRPLSVVSRPGSRVPEPRADHPDFHGLVAAAAERLVFSKEERQAMLGAALKIVEARVEAIVPPRYREGYPSTVAAILAAAEALCLSGQRKAGEAFIASILHSCRRHTTFCGELESARRRTRILAGDTDERRDEGP
ncbi:MAG: hypothetical protein JXP34_20645 [Planctomycetes bacterium]|nr:hypothetical protein [Planctomycetota bacterium]